MLLCDFCSSRSVKWAYPANSFELSDFCGSDGSWAACDTCHALIERGDRAALLRRSVTTFFDAHGEARDSRAISRHMRVIHEGFFCHRIGPAQEIV